MTQYDSDLTSLIELDNSLLDGDATLSVRFDDNANRAMDRASTAESSPRFIRALLGGEPWIDLLARRNDDVIVDRRMMGVRPSFVVRPHGDFVDVLASVRVPLGTRERGIGGVSFFPNAGTRDMERFGLASLGTITPSLVARFTRAFWASDMAVEEHANALYLNIWMNHERGRGLTNYAWSVNTYGAALRASVRAEIAPDWEEDPEEPRRLLRGPRIIEM